MGKKPELTVQVAGKRWRLVYDPQVKKDWGDCDRPDLPNKQIRINPRKRGRDRLEAEIHELLHASAWRLLSETWVTDTARDLSRILYQLGYRLTEEDE